MHWAARLIGADHEQIGRCWGLVRHCAAERFGDAMPAIEVGDPEDQTTHIKRAAGSAGWRRVEAACPVADDIVVMQGPEGRHVAWAVDADGELAVLHTRSKTAGVEVHGWRELPALGFHTFEIWRRGL